MMEILAGIGVLAVAFLVSVAIHKVLHFVQDTATRIDSLEKGAESHETYTRARLATLTKYIENLEIKGSKKK